MTKRPRIRVAYSTRGVRLKVHGHERIDSSTGTKNGVKKLPDKGKDRVSPKRGR